MGAKTHALIRPKSDYRLFESPSARRTAILLGSAVLLAALWVNRSVLGFGFLYLRDDDTNLTLNPYMGGISPEHLKWMFTDWQYSRRFIPFGWMGFSAVYSAAGLHPFAYHALGLALLAVNTALVYIIILLSLRNVLGPDKPLDTGAIAAAAAGAAWWGLNPLRVETTAWVSGNLYGTAAAVALVSAVAYLQTYVPGVKRRMPWVLLCTLGYVVSVLTYPIALAAPVVALALDVVNASVRTTKDLKERIREKLVLFAACAAGLAATLAARSSNTNFGPVPDLKVLPLGHRLAQACFIAVHYLWRPWWPVHLSPVYDTLVAFSPAEPAFVVSCALVAAVSVAVAWKARTRPVGAALWFGYLGFASPYFGFTESPHFPSDRYGYLLTVPMAAVLAWGLSRVPRGLPGKVAAVGAVAVAIIFSWLCTRQLPIWADDRTQHTYVAGLLTKEEILEDFTSRDLILRFMKGDEQAAAGAVREHLQRHPASTGFHTASVIIADKERVRPYYGSTPYLAMLHERLALEFARRGERREAIDHFEAALEFAPRFYQADFDRALVLLDLGRPREALHSFLLAQAYAPKPFTAAQVWEFRSRLAACAASCGLKELAAAAKP